MEIRTERLIIRSLTVDDIPLLQNYFFRNRFFLKRWEPARPDSYYTRDSLFKMLAAEKIDEKRRTAIRVYLFLKENPTVLIGFAALTSIQYGYVLSCQLGYKLDSEYINRGLMSETLSSLIDYAFHSLGLHRIESNVMPTNMPSRRIMEKFQFTEEGIKKRYRKINGTWEDHIQYSLYNKELEIDC